MPVTTEDIAKRVGVSSRLVRYALNGHPKVGEQTREKIREAARELGYRPGSNNNARSLIARRYGKRIRQNALAVLIPREAAGTISSMPFFTEILDGIELESNQYHYQGNADIDLILISLLKPGVPRFFEDVNIDGVICLKSLTPEEVAGYQERRVPLIAAGHVVNGLCGIVADDLTGMRQAVAHLAGLGHRRIAYLGPSPGFEIAQRRLDGFRSGLEQCGLTYDPELVEATIQTMSTTGEITRRMLARRADFTALVCYNDLAAMHAVEALRQAGRRVPCDVSVVGFDDTSVQERFSLPLTSVYFDRVSIGRRAVRWIYEQFDSGGGAVLEAHTEFVPVELKIRESTAAPPTAG